MPTRERLAFISAPIPIRNVLVVDAAKRMARAVGQSSSVTIDELVRLPKQSMTENPNQKLDLEHLESTHRVIMLYMWLG